MQKGYIVRSATNAPAIRFLVVDDIPPHVRKALADDGDPADDEPTPCLYAEAFGMSAAVMELETKGGERDSLVVYGLSAYDQGIMTVMFLNRSAGFACGEIASRMWSHRSAMLAEPPAGYNPIEAFGLTEDDDE